MLQKGLNWNTSAIRCKKGWCHLKMLRLCDARMDDGTTKKLEDAASPCDKSDDDTIPSWIASGNLKMLHALLYDTRKDGPLGDLPSLSPSTMQGGKLLEGSLMILHILDTRKDSAIKNFGDSSSCVKLYFIDN